MPKGLKRKPKGKLKRKPKKKLKRK